MDYSILTEEQIQKRYDSLPIKLRDISDSENAIEMVRQLCRTHHLDEDRVLIIEQLIGLVILGFISVEELSQEIQENIHLNPRHSAELSQEINRKIFSPIKSELEKVYAPPAGAEEVLDLRSKQPVPEIIKSPVVSRVEPPKIIPESPHLPELGPRLTSAARALEPAPAGEQAREPEEEGPMIIHKETQFEPLLEKKKSLSGLFGAFKKQEEKKPPSVMAKVDIGGKAKEPHMASRVEPPKVRVVHYSEFLTPITPFLEAPEAKEEKKEATPPENLPLVKPEVPKPVLDLRRIAELKKAEVEKPLDKPFMASRAEPPVVSRVEPPKAEPTKIEPPVVSRVEPPKPKPAGRDGEMIDLRTFK